MAIRQKKCKVCGDKFTPFNSIQPTCGNFECNMTYAMAVVQKNDAKKAKDEAKATREAKTRAKPRSKWMAEAQAAVNKVIRLRDKDRPCISCGTHTAGKWDAGHYRSVGSNPALRFEPLNIHKQCVPCNQHLSGNAMEYRIGLIARIGQEAVDFLEGPHEAKHYTIDDLKKIKADYNRIAKEMECTTTSAI